MKDNLNEKAVMKKAMNALLKQRLHEEKIKEIKGGNGDDPLIIFEGPIIWGMFPE